MSLPMSSAYSTLGHHGSLCLGKLAAENNALPSTQHPTEGLLLGKGTSRSLMRPSHGNSSFQDQAGAISGLVASPTHYAIQCIHPVRLRQCPDRTLPTSTSQPAVEAQTGGGGVGRVRDLPRPASCARWTEIGVGG